MYRLYPYIINLIKQSQLNQYGVSSSRDDEMLKGINNIISINILYDEGRKEFSCNGITEQEFDPSKNAERYGYVLKDANSPIIFPTIRLTYDKDKSPQGNADNRFKALMSFFKNKKIVNDEFINRLNKYLCETKNTIVQYILSVINNSNTLLTFSINNIPIYSSKYLINYKERLLNQDQSDNYKVGNCSICFLSNIPVTVESGPLNFYTHKTDKSVLFKHDTLKDNMLPICKTCRDKLNKVKRVVFDINGNNFKHKFCNNQYVIIPEFVFDSSQNSQIMQIFKDSDINKFRQEYKLSNDDTNVILRILGYTNNIALYHMMFYEQNNAQFTIIDIINGIYPEMFKNIFSVKQEVEKYEIFKNAIRNKDKTTSDIYLTFDQIKYIISNSKEDKSYFKYITSVFKGTKVSYDTIIIHGMKNICSKILNNESPTYMVKSTLMWLLFLHKLNLFTKRSVNMKTNVETKYNFCFNNEQYELINTPLKRALFLMGILFSSISTVQCNSLNTERAPIEDKLKGYRFNNRMIQSLYTELQKKMKEYSDSWLNSRKIGDLSESISVYLKYSSNEQLSSSEMGYMFVLGKTLSNYILKDYDKYNVKEVNENE